MTSSIFSFDPLTLLKSVCLVSGFLLHVAPLSTMKQIRTAGNTLSFHIAPYCSTLLNHSVNLWYALVREDAALVCHRVLGIGFQLFYIITFMKYCVPAKIDLSKEWIRNVVLVFSSLVAWLLLICPLLGFDKYYKTQLAFFGAITGVLLAASPLVTLREILAKKDASSLPFQLCAMVTLQCFSWSVYGYVRDDMSTLSNNLVGFCLGVFQLILIQLYGGGPSKLETLEKVTVSD